MFYLMKGLAEVQYKNVSLLPFIKMSCKIFYRASELCFAAVPFPESMLKGSKNVITLKIIPDLLVNDVLNNFTRDTC